jgi:hypothetical protein
MVIDYVKESIKAGNPFALHIFARGNETEDMKMEAYKNGLKKEINNVKDAVKNGKDAFMYAATAIEYAKKLGKEEETASELEKLCGWIR